MISARTILRGALTRTIPAVWLGFAALIALSPVARSNISVGRLALTATAGLAVAMGSALMLFLLRRHLRVDAGAGGRRAFLVGLGAFGVMITIRPFLSNIGTAGEYALMAACGAALAAAVFFPWVASSRRADSLADAMSAAEARGRPAPDPVESLATRREGEVIERDRRA